MVLPALVIVGILATVGVLGYGGTSSAIDKEEIQQKVSKLLTGIPQQGTTLGSPEAPVTVWVYADLECATVRLFVESYLPSIIDTWVRTGDVKLTYRSMRTDTYNEEIFFRQEIAARAAGRQDGMWTYFLTFAHQQGEQFTDYATDAFLTDIASQVPGLAMAQWHRDREDTLLSKRVAHDVYSAHDWELSSTPSFLVGLSVNGGGKGESQVGMASLRREVEVSLGKHVDALGREAFKDAPTVGPLGLSKQEIGSD
ncbi:MAG TPA: thioredoxin domain-containing protein [Solirubrobacterales bacterium]